MRASAATRLRLHLQMSAAQLPDPRVRGAPDKTRKAHRAALVHLAPHRIKTRLRKTRRPQRTAIDRFQRAPSSILGRILVTNHRHPNGTRHSHHSCHCDSNQSCTRISAALEIVTGLRNVGEARPKRGAKSLRTDSGSSRLASGAETRENRTIWEELGKEQQMELYDASSQYPGFEYPHDLEKAAEARWRLPNVRRRQRRHLPLLPRALKRRFIPILSS